MIIEDITFSEIERTEVLPESSIPLIELIPVQSKVINALKLFMEAYESKEWLHKATIRVLSTLYIKEAGVQIERAKTVIKEKYPIKNKIEVWKTLFKNPIKSLWLLKLR